MPTVPERRATFRRLHQSGCFAIPNPWDIGSTRYLEHLGFPALASTSSGLSFSQGLPDADWAVPRDAVLAHLASLVAATDLPVNADFESGYAHDPDGVAANVTLCVRTGVAGLSIEDATGRPEQPLYDVETAVARISAARAAIDAEAVNDPPLLTARSEAFLVGHAAPLEEAVRRLVLFAQAGADVLYAPGVRTKAEIAAVVKAVAPKPVNVLAMAVSGLTMADLAALGVRRVSVGSAFARAAWGGFIRAAKALADHGSFEPLAEATPFPELNAFFREDLKRRSAR